MFTSMFTSGILKYYSMVNQGNWFAKEILGIFMSFKLINYFDSLSLRLYRIK